MLSPQQDCFREGTSCVWHQVHLMEILHPERWGVDVSDRLQAGHPSLMLSVATVVRKFPRHFLKAGSPRPDDDSLSRQRCVGGFKLTFYSQPCRPDLRGVDDSQKLGPKCVAWPTFTDMLQLYTDPDCPSGGERAKLETFSRQSGCHHLGFCTSTA